jgi:hypothetical protein
LSRFLGLNVQMLTSSRYGLIEREAGIEMTYGTWV